MSAESTVESARTVEIAESLTIPAPWDLTALLHTVACGRGKPIRLIAHAGLASTGQTCGLWIGRAEDDIIVYDSATSEYHAEQIILHELGHILLGHSDGAAMGSPAALEQLISDVPASTVRHMLGRSAFDDEQECQAELFASLVMSRRGPSTPQSRLVDTFLAD